MLNNNVKVIITGANGLIGKKLCKALENNYFLIKVDKDGEGLLNYDLYEDAVWDKLEYEIGDTKAVLVNLAFSFSGKEHVYEDNIRLIKKIIGFAQRNLSVKIVYPSTVLVYGTKQDGIVTETTIPEPASNYARTKLAIENLLLDELKDRSTVLRLTNMYSRFISEKAVIGKLLKQIQNNQKIDLLDYNSVRDFIYIEDVINAFQKMIDYLLFFNNIQHQNKVISPYTVFNISTGQGTQIYDFICRIAEAYNKADLIPGREEVINTGLQEKLIISSDRFKDLFKQKLLESSGISKWEPLSVDEGIRRMVYDEK